MLIKRPYLFKIYSIITSKLNEVFDIQTQYKLIKLKKILEEEVQIYQEQLNSLSKFFEIKDGHIVQNDNGGIKIKEDKMEECLNTVNDINNIQAQVPDIYFCLEELAPLKLTLQELEYFDSFIK